MKQRTTGGLPSESQQQRSLQNIKFGGTWWSAVPRAADGWNFLNQRKNGKEGLQLDVQALRTRQAVGKGLHAIGEKLRDGDAAWLVRGIIPRALAILVLAARPATIPSRGELEFLHAKPQRSPCHWHNKSKGDQQAQGFEARQHDETLI